MNDQYFVRNYQPKDLQKFTDLVTKEGIYLPEHHLSSATIRAHLNRPNHSPDVDLFIIDNNVNLVGYLEITREPEIERVILECWIHPEHRYKGLAKRLLTKAISRAHELSIPRLQVNIMDSNKLAQKVLTRLGFKCVRKYNELRLTASVLNLPQTPDNQIAPRSLRNGEEIILTDLQNRCFAGSWGYHPNTVEAINYRMNSSGCSPQDVILIYQEDRPISYCWTEITPPSTSSNKRAGRIYMIGVDPDYRGRGLGRKVLVTGLTHLKNKGAEIIELTVDSTNHVACSLYRTIGFTKRATSLWYERQA